MKNRKWVLAVALGLLTSGAPVAVGAEVNAGPGNATTNLTNVSSGFELADGSSSIAANSTAQFDLTAGTLALYAVPNLHFQSGSIEKLISGAVTLNFDTEKVTPDDQNFDGNNFQQLVVEDYRGTNAGWQVTANLGAFSGKKAITADQITLDGPVGGSNTTNVSFTNANFAGTNATVLNAPQDAGSGLTNVEVVEGELVLPEDNAALAGTYQATVNWALVTAPSAS